MAPAVNLDANGPHPIERWIEVISAANLPVLGQTLRQLSKLRANEENVRPRDLSQIDQVARAVIARVTPSLPS